MTGKPTYEELELRIKDLETEVIGFDRLQKELEKIFNFSPDMIGSGSLDGYFTKINSSFEELLGYSEKEFLRKPFLSFVHQEDVEKTAEALATAGKGKNHTFIENRYKCKNGSYKWIEWKVQSLSEENRFITVGRDITNRKQTEKDRFAHLSFLENTDRLDRAIRNATDLEQMMGNVLETALSIFSCDRAWLLFPCDPDAAFWSVPMERTVPEYPGAFALGKDLPMTSDMTVQFKAALESEGPLIFDPESDRPMPDSARQFSTLSTINMAIYPKIGRPWIWGISQCSHTRVWTVQEIQLFKEIGRRIADALSSLLFLRDLKESEKRFRDLANNSPTAICILREDRYLYVNSSWEDLTGYSREEAQTLNPLMVVHPDMRDQVRIRAGDRIKGNQVPRRYEMKGINKRGDVLWLDFSGTVIQYDKNPAVLSLAVDITDRKQAEEERERLINELQIALENIKTLRGLLPICANCKKIRDDKGYWNQIEGYIERHSDALFSHGLCPECMDEIYSDQDWYKKEDYDM